MVNPLICKIVYLSTVN